MAVSLKVTFKVYSTKLENATVFLNLFKNLVDSVFGKICINKSNSAIDESLLAWYNASTNNWGKMKVAISRKYLLKECPPLNGLQSELIEQSYLEVGQNERRVREVGGQYFYTEKVGTGLVREEQTKQISCIDYLTKTSKRVGNIITKMRYYVPVKNDYVVKIDVYKGSLAGFVLAEVSFEDYNRLARFARPSWLGEEVTRDNRYSTASLAVNGLPEDENQM